MGEKKMFEEVRKDLKRLEDKIPQIKVVFITATLVPEASEMKDEEIERAIRLYLKPEDVPFVEKIEKVKVLSEG